MPKILCIYHGNCADGFGAAWAVRHALGADNVEFHAGVYQSPPPDVAGRDVIMVDFSYKRPILDAMLQSADVKQASSILILDHHKSAAEDLDGLTRPGDGIYEKGDASFRPDLWRAGWEQMTEWPVRAVFDMERSGAGLTWDYFNPGNSRPPLIDHIEDRDLWRFNLDGTREIQANVFSYPYDFEVWDRLMAMDTAELRSDGAAIERKHFKDIREFIAAAGYRATLAGHEVPFLNAPYFWSSDAGHIMAQGEKFAACYWDTPDGRVFSLRSADDGMDVSEVAKAFGGGGHKHAAGFKVPVGASVA